MLGAENTLMQGPRLEFGPTSGKGARYFEAVTVGLFVRLLDLGCDPPREQHTRVAIIDVENWWNALFLLR